MERLLALSLRDFPRLVAFTRGEYAIFRTVLASRLRLERGGRIVELETIALG